ncbi:MAG: hypothetical protein ACKPKO_61180, partial [Candidatus Fonsibacter sp.]
LVGDTPHSQLAAGVIGIIIVGKVTWLSKNMLLSCFRIFALCFGALASVSSYAISFSPRFLVRRL